MATELEREQEALRKSSIDITEGHARIDRQVALIAEMQARGFETDEGERFLGLLNEALTQWEKHHELIVERIAYLQLQAVGTRRGRDS